MVVVVGKRSGAKKDGSGTYLSVLLLVPAVGRGAFGYSYAEELVDPDLERSLSAIPGVYETVEEKRAYRGRIGSSIVGFSLVSEGWPTP